MPIGLPALLAASLALLAPGPGVAQSVNMGPSGASSAAPAGYREVEPTDICPEIFQRRYQRFPEGPASDPELSRADRGGPPDNVTLEKWPCRHFRFYPLTDPTARMEQDRLLVTPHTSAFFHACYIADLIHSIEALPRRRFVELRFENVSIHGLLHLADIDVPARLTFLNVDFIRPNLGRSDGGLTVPTDCNHPPVADPDLGSTSVFFQRVTFTDSVVFKHARFDGDLISRHSTYAHRFDLIGGDVGGDLVLESSDFDRDLVLGQETIFRGQIVLDGVRVHGDIALDDVELIDTYLQPEDTAPLEQLGEGKLRTILERARACVCVERDRSVRVDWGKLNDGGPTSELQQDMAEVCSFFPNLPRCPRSNGFLPALIELNDIEIEGALSVADLDLGAKKTDFRPFKSNPGRFAALDSGKPDSREQIRGESSLSRLTSTEIVLYNISAGRSVELINNQSSGVYVSHSIVDFLNSEKNEFDKLVVFRNSIGMVKSLRDTFYQGLSVTRNEISRSLILDSTTFDGSLLGDAPGTLDVEVAHNRVGQDLTFAPFDFVAGAVGMLDLSGNQVEGEVHVGLPTAAGGPDGTPSLAWTGDIRLTNLHVNGAVALELTKQARNDEANQRRAIVDVGHDIPKHFEPCASPGNEDAAIRIQLEDTRATRINWALPLKPVRPVNGGDDRDDAECLTWASWTGTGLRYDGWEPSGGWPNPDVGSDSMANADFRAWGDLYPAAPADPLHHMADYLWSLGHQSESRSVRSEAKRAAFPIPAEGSLAATIGNVVARFILWPTDFGLRPERAVGLLLTVVVLAWGVYQLSMFRWRKVWDVARAKRDALSRREKLDEAIREHLVLQEVDRALHETSRPAHYRGMSEAARPWRPEGQIDLERLLRTYALMPDERSEQEDKPYDKSLKASLSRMFRGLKDRIATTLKELTDPPSVPDNLIMNISSVPGFMQRDRDRQPQDFNLLRLAVDVTIPVIDLHAYNQYFPARRGLRTFMVLQHLIGWWVLTSFLASLAVL